MQKMLKVIIILSLIFGLGDALATFKVGLVDVNSVLQNNPLTKLLQANIQKKFKAQGDKLISIREEFIQDVDALKKLPPNKAKERQVLAQKIEEKANKLQVMQMKLQNDLAMAQKDAMNILSKQIREVTHKIAKEQKIDLVLSKSLVAYSSDDIQKMDITDLVIKRVQK